MSYMSDAQSLGVQFSEQLWSRDDMLEYARRQGYIPSSSHPIFVDILPYVTAYLTYKSKMIHEKSRTFYNTYQLNRKSKHSQLKRKFMNKYA